MSIQPPRARQPRLSYWPLVQYLQALPSDAPAVILDLQAIRDLLGGTLPLGAGLTNFWAASIVAAATWNRAGFSASLDSERQQVTFRRR
jgi:hypothetical protein